MQQFLFLLLALSGTILCMDMDSEVSPSEDPKTLAYNNFLKNARTHLSTIYTDQKIQYPDKLNFTQEVGSLKQELQSLLTETKNCINRARLRSSLVWGTIFIGGMIYCSAPFASKQFLLGTYKRLYHPLSYILCTLITCLAGLQFYQHNWGRWSSSTLNRRLDNYHHDLLTMLNNIPTVSPKPALSFSNNNDNNTKTDIPEKNDQEDQAKSAESTKQEITQKKQNPFQEKQQEENKKNAKDIEKNHIEETYKALLEKAKSHLANNESSNEDFDSYNPKNDGQLYIPELKNFINVITNQDGKKIEYFDCQSYQDQDPCHNYRRVIASGLPHLQKAFTGEGNHVVLSYANDDEYNHAYISWYSACSNEAGSYLKLETVNDRSIKISKVPLPTFSPAEKKEKLVNTIVKYLNDHDYVCISINNDLIDDIQQSESLRKKIFTGKKTFLGTNDKEPYTISLIATHHELLNCTKKETITYYVDSAHPKEISIEDAVTLLKTYKKITISSDDYLQHRNQLIKSNEYAKKGSLSPYTVCPVVEKTTIIHDDYYYFEHSKPIRTGLLYSPGTAMLKKPLPIQS